VAIRVIRVLSALAETLSRLARYGELHFFRLFDDLRGLENFESDYPAIVAEVSDDTGANLVAFLHALVAKRDGKRVSFPVVFSLHAVASYFLNFDGFVKRDHDHLRVGLLYPPRAATSPPGEFRLK
jgi:hypothetical protein